MARSKVTVASNLLNLHIYVFTNGLIKNDSIHSVGRITETPCLSLVLMNCDKLFHSLYHSTRLIA